MRTNQPLVQFIRNAIIGVVLLAAPHLARATILNPDGGFSAQTVGSLMGAPWAFDDWATCHNAAQSPFTNVYANDGKGSYWASTGAPHGLGAPISPAAAPGSGTYYFNVDFKLNNAGSYLNNGWSFTLAHGYAAVTTAVRLFVSGDGASGTKRLTVVGGDGTQEIPLTSLGGNDWYNIQLTLHMTGATSTFSGLLTAFGGTQTAINTLTFLDSTVTIDSLYTDHYYNGPLDNTPDMYADNYAFYTIPEPATLLLFGIGGLLLWWQQRR